MPNVPSIRMTRYSLIRGEVTRNEKVTPSGAPALRKPMKSDGVALALIKPHQCVRQPICELQQHLPEDLSDELSFSQQQGSVVSALSFIFWSSL